MGGVAILHSQDVLNKHFVKQPLISSSPPRIKQQQPRTTNRRRKTPSSSPVPNKAMINKIPPPHVMGQVKILKRGQDLDLDLPTTDRVFDAVKAVGTGGMNRIRVDREVTDRLGPEQQVFSKRINVLTGFYAGSAVVASPPPSSLPLPGFFSKNVDSNKHATNDLLRILRLNLA